MERKIFFYVLNFLLCYHWLSGAVELSNPSSGPVSICGPMPLPPRSDFGMNWRVPPLDARGLEKDHRVFI
ncbi:unnamed protein product [Tenebrio molitor]|jgi:hypothetical protein|nr:unnamed protein product [Tenebrio molitor]